jgi:hypothetical protein
VNYDDRKANAGKAADGYYCFEMDRARMDFMQYWLTADFATTGMTSGKSAKWEVVYDKGRAINRVASAAESAAERDPANPYNNQAAIFPSGGNTASIVQASMLVAPSALVTPAARASIAVGVGKLDVSWYQPKW